MITTANIFEFLRPNGGWIVSEGDWENAQYLECEPITKAEFEQGVKDYEQYLIDQAAAQSAAKAAAEAKLAALGLTKEDLEALGL